jgi:hypothetical protein
VKRCGLLFLTFASVACAQGDGSALDALKLLPKDSAKNLARIEAREGAPAPERWYFLVHDPGVPRGMREFVVTGGRIVANRIFSQFADGLKPSDVFGAASVKIDSREVARQAALFTAANGGRVGTVSYELLKAPAENAVVWRATVLDENGDQLGALVIHAGVGTVLSHDGFEKEPPPEPIRAGPPSRRSARPVATPVPRPKFFQRIFGANDRKPADAAQ